MPLGGFDLKHNEVSQVFAGEALIAPTDEQRVVAIGVLQSCPYPIG